MHSLKWVVNIVDQPKFAVLRQACTRYLSVKNGLTLRWGLFAMSNIVIIFSGLELIFKVDLR